MTKNLNDTYVTTREAKKVINVTNDTLRRWADSGKIPSIKTPTGQRLYDIRKFLSVKEEDGKQKICYCRVSSANQKDDLQRQVLFMSEKFPNHRIITDIGSGINFRRKGLCSLLDMVSKGVVSEVVVAYRDRLCRFAFELLERVFFNNGADIVVLNKSVESSENGELAEDLLAIINVFNCRVNGKRKYKKDKGEKGDESEAQSKEESDEQLIDDCQAESTT